MVGAPVRSRGLRIAGAAAALLLASGPAVRAAPAPGLSETVSLPEAPELAAAPRVADRLLPPLAAEGLRRQLAREDHRLINPAIDPAAERFTVYVPATRPPGGYGLLVFVPPWRAAKLPPGWAEALDRHGIIYVSAANSGNDAKPCDLTISSSRFRRCSAETTIKLQKSVAPDERIMPLFVTEINQNMSFYDNFKSKY